MNAAGPVAAYVEQTRSLLRATLADLQRYRRGIDASQNAIQRSNRIAEECRRKTRSLKSALIVK